MLSQETKDKRVKVATAELEATEARVARTVKRLEAFDTDKAALEEKVLAARIARAEAQASLEYAKSAPVAGQIALPVDDAHDGPVDEDGEWIDDETDDETDDEDVPETGAPVRGPGGQFLPRQ